ncbi:regulatory-associated protein of mTOR-like isoform X1 [Mizuhopecten yessoensis]|uniref:Regulatory-associated protein of mTOR n=1 Tax=Mizuhopecten yessoensis TaxID=6573 RepID=A0A210QSX3_MIZYE|nr:regulatory-associated protein of mTOR-like isoform X1 [Mizuhopecten yessoensis]OWF51799.1 Regulatory-associated protein of mTOR [Mizuhopecten yessoensis]
MLNLTQSVTSEGDVIAELCDEEDELYDWHLPVAFNELRNREKIEGSTKVTQTWRMKERMKTVSVALVLCLNVGVDPPDVVKTSPCARLESWIDPTTSSPQKALEAIGSNLQKQYERWQPRARYKQSLDPTVDEVKKLCSSLRRNAKEERVLFHYNGHGVPKPTVNGEIWVFNKSYTQYIPLSVYDLQTWMGSPSIYVYDCSNAGIIVESFKQFSVQREHEMETSSSISGSQRFNSPTPSPAAVKNCIQLAACGSTEFLPMNPELPADLFTSCLTTPIKIALKWYVLQNTSKLVPNLTAELVDKVPGQLNDRRTMLGELNWIFTAITDTIAWNTLPRDLFQKLFRQDLLVASLFRNFLLAERIMRSYNCTPVSGPKLPPTYQHPMWQAWDLALDLCLRQLPRLLEDDGPTFQHSPFFTEQLTAFQVWLTYGSEARNPPEQLPIVLQVLLSQVHRLRALDLLGRFLDLGPWAVSLALSVGIFPYVLKLLQSSARELRPLLVFIWAKILSVDSSCQADLVKDNGHKYFLAVLADPYMPAEHRTMAAFVLSMIVNDYRQGQEAALQGNVISVCLEQLADSNASLRQWLALCLGKVWTSFDNARWCGVRDSAHEKLAKMLTDSTPEVRAATVYALGAFINNNSAERSDHANNIDLGVAMTLASVGQDGNPLVRKELVVAFRYLVTQFESQFATVATQLIEEERQKDKAVPIVAAEAPGGWNVVASSVIPENFASVMTSGMKRSSSRTSVKSLLPSTSSGLQPSPGNTSFCSSISSMDSTSSVESMSNVPDTRGKRAGSNPSIPGLSFSNIYIMVWKTLIQLAVDPVHEVADMAKYIVNTIKLKATTTSKPSQMIPNPAMTHSAPASPSNRPVNPAQGTPPQNYLFDESGRPVTGGIKRDFSSPRLPSTTSSPYTYSTQFSRNRKIFDKGPTQVEEKEDGSASRVKHPSVVSTDYFPWCCKHFAQPLMRLSDEQDPESFPHHEREYHFTRNAHVRNEAKEEQLRAGFNRLDDQVFVNRNPGIPSVIKFHPYESFMAVADKDNVSFWNWEQGTKLGSIYNENPKHTKITSIEFLNAHDDTLMLTGSDDGAVRIWRDCLEDVEIVSAFQALSDMIPLSRGSGLVIDWEQESGMLLASGDVRTIKIWDSRSEMKLQDIPTGADSCVTSLASDSVGRSLLIAGCGDGTVRLFDRRLGPTECRVMTLREHNHRVLNVHLQKGSEGKIVSTSNGGDVRFWDPRFTESVRVLNLQQGLTAVDMHNLADVIACGSMNQYIGVYNQSGDSLSTIKYHEGFLGQRIGAISCLAFHPYKVKLAAGGSDSFISVYSTSMKRS